MPEKKKKKPDADLEQFKLDGMSAQQKQFALYCNDLSMVVNAAAQKLTDRYTVKQTEFIRNELKQTGLSCAITATFTLSILPVKKKK